MQNHRVVAVLGLTLWLVIAAGAVESRSSGLAEGEVQADDILAQYGVVPLEGTAAGLVDDQACAAGGCHAEINDTYPATDKAHSFLAPRQDRFVADFGQVFYHDLSQRYYQIVRNGDQLLFRRFQKDDQGEVINLLELEIAWLHGSGTLARAYIYRAPCGQLHQLPLVWYGTPGKWGMGPGFDESAHIGVQRVVQRECQFCHNGYSALPKGGDALFAPEVFPEHLTQGISCQRCHGPGEEHVRLGLLALQPENKIKAEAVRTSVVNQNDLSSRLNDDVCNQCHARTSKMVSAVRRFGRGIFSYRAGEPLSDYLINVRVTRSGSKFEGRIGAISQPTRTKKSQCYQSSKGELTCTFCHEAHRKIPAAEKPAHYRAACLRCHSDDSCNVKAETKPAVDRKDCIGCHMPKRPSTVQDFPITDHLIERDPNIDIPPSSLRNQHVQIDDAWVDDITGPDAQLYKLSAIVRTSANLETAHRLQQVLVDREEKTVEPYLLLAFAFIRNHEFDQAMATVLQVLARDPENLQAQQWKTLILFATGQRAKAIALQRDVVEREPSWVDARFNLGLFLFESDKTSDAIEVFSQTVASAPLWFKAWYYLGECQERSGKLIEASAAYHQALAVEPTFSRAYLSLGEVLLQQGEKEEARRYWQHGLRVADQKEALQKAYALEFGERQ